MDIDFDPTNCLMPVFPLPNVVLFPGTILPLYIFEQRYIEMTRDVLRGNRMIAITLLKDGWQSNYNGSPDIYMTGTVGKIIEYQKLSKGRFNIILYGISKVSMKEIVSEKPYRIVHTSMIKEPESDINQLDVVVKEIKRDYTLLLKRVVVPMYYDIMSQPGIDSLQYLNNLIAGLRVDVKTKQQLLLNTPLERIGMISAILKEIAIESGNPKGIKQKPGVSLN